MKIFNVTVKNGHFFGIVISDEDSSIHVTFFNDMALDYFDKITEGQVYSI